MNPLSRTALAARYAGFAVVATVTNLGTQRILLPAEPAVLDYSVALGAGTLAGLVVKYLLDKRWIFFDRAAGLRAHGRRFTLYTVTGIATTAIFWGVETAFWMTWGTTGMRELGGVIGLTIGYSLKYQLDKRYVFDRIFADP